MDEKWQIAYRDGSGPADITIEGEMAIATVRWGCSCCRDDSPLTDVEKERMRLIVTAPKMLKACNDSLTVIGGLKQYMPKGNRTAVIAVDEFMNLIRDIINEVEGK